MNLKKIEPEDFSAFQKEIEKIRNTVDRTLNLSWFYMYARFRMTQGEFQSTFSVDGRNDGGIDCYFKEGNTFYIIQSKYHIKSQKESSANIKQELQKIEKTIVAENTNKSAEEFINGLRREVKNDNFYLEIIWLTTNEITEKVRAESQEYLDKILSNRSWEINAEINFIDRFALEGVIYDIKHGYVPHTGKKSLKIEAGEYMKIGKDRNNIEGIVCNIKAKEILSWFNSATDINTFLQKNVRESVGDKSTINKAIRRSYKEDPTLFWYKHNGIIVFADWIDINAQNTVISIRNPQIVNGGQTVTQLYKAFDEDRNSNNPTKLLVRIYRLPYEDAETYKRSIDIIAALNTQNKIKSSDLHSTDPRQVMLENRLDELGTSYRYYRKRSDQGKISSPNNIFMTKLALYYYVCEYRKPDEGIAGEIETFFEEQKRYDDSFPASLIKKPLSKGVDHIIYNYVECWNLHFLIHRHFSWEITKKQEEYFLYVSWYLLVDIYQQIQNWKEKVYTGTGREWLEFIDSPEFRNGIIKYSKLRYNIYMKMLPKRELEPRNFYKSVEGRKKFLSNSGNINQFKSLLKKSYELFRKHNQY
ncbi:MAG: AIPR family protein [Ignavibacterium sp.]|jgi:hypothetical protein|nr:AIPR family protein [Ignavibacterium sp.]